MVDLSVIIAAWNAEDTIQRCVKSALAQHDVSLEVIVADDCSTDGTTRLVAEMAAQDPRVKLLLADRNGGPSAARNRAIAAACGTWLAILDADDHFEPERACLLLATAKNRQAHIVFDNMCVFQDAPDNVIRKEGYFLNRAKFSNEQQWSLRDFIAGNLWELGSPGLGYLKPIFQRSFLTENDLWYDETLRNSEDYMLVTHCLAKGGAAWYVPQPLYNYRMTAGSISHRVAPELLDALLAASDRFTARFGAAMSPETLMLNARRRSQISALRTTERALDAIKRGDVLAASLALGRHPSSVTRFAWHLGEAAVSRVKRLGDRIS